MPRATCATYCRSSSRNQQLLCVVSEPRDIPPIERTAVFQGVYHVLGGALSPMDGIGPDDLRIPQLMQRLGSEDIQEVVLATNPNVEGEDHGSLPGAPDQALGHQGHASCQRPSRGRGPGVCRRGDARTGVGGQARAVAPTSPCARSQAHRKMWERIGPRSRTAAGPSCFA